jgi:alpha-beta hydrolase superfamily lysophospholipase
MRQRKQNARRWTRWIFRIAIALFVAVNVAAFVFARKMLVFSEGGGTPRTKYSFATTAAIFFEGVPKPQIHQKPDALDLGYTTVVLRAAGKPDLEAWRIPCEKPRATVALFHGHCAAKSQLLPEAKAFHEMGCEVWLLDFYGSGGSSGSSTGIGYFEAEDVKRLFDLIRPDSPHPVVLYGVSMGAAAIARAVGELGVKPDGIVLASSFNRMTATVAHRVEAVGFPGTPLAQLIVFWGGVQMGINGFALNPADYARGISCPALLLQGSRDTMVRNAEAEETFDHLAGSRKIATFEGAGHGNFLNYDPAKWRAEISGWLQRVIASDASPSQARQSPR